MSRPQQPELERTPGRGEIDQKGRRVTREQERQGGSRERGGKVPPENRPGHHPEKEQDKPGA